MGGRVVGFTEDGRLMKQGRCSTGHPQMHNIAHTVPNLQSFHINLSSAVVSGVSQCHSVVLDLIANAMI